MPRPLSRTSTATFALVAFCAGTGLVLGDPYVAPICEGPPASTQHDSWFSLPNQSWIGTAEELCLALGPMAVAVSQMHAAGATGNTGPEEYTYTCPVGVVPGSCAAIGNSPAPPEPGCSTSDCFCLDDGEGFGVFLAAGTGATALTVDGCYTPFPAAVAANSSYLISVAQDAALVTFADLAAALGLTAAGPIRGTMTRLDCATGALSTLSAGMAAAAGASLLPGTAYRIRNPTPLVYANPVDPAPCACTETSFYEITGTGDGTDYAWWLDAGKNESFVVGEFFAPVVVGAPLGAPAEVLAANLVDSIGAVAAPLCTAAVVSFAPAVIAITCTPCSFDLWVAPAAAGGVPPFPLQCPVVTAPCTFNPTITKIFPEPTGNVGQTLRVEHAATPGDITLSWAEACVAGAGDFGIYQGEIGSWYSHESILCSTGGATFVTVTPPAADAYYLVVPRRGVFEGFYGRDSAGTPLPPGGGACGVPLIAPACP